MKAFIRLEIGGIISHNFLGQILKSEIFIWKFLWTNTENVETFKLLESTSIFAQFVKMSEL